MPRATRALLLALTLLSACTAPALSGTDLGRQPAPDFTLTDAMSGRAVSLSGQRGKAVALTFLYTNCPDVCPLTAVKLRDARAALGGDAASVAFLAVSVDPARDTPQAVREFLERRGALGTLRYLIGDRAALAAVWRAYFLHTEQQGELVGHTDAIFLIDKQGRARTLLRSEVDVDVLVRDLRTLAREARIF